MSRNAWTALVASTAFTCGVIYYVHYSQTRDKMRLREGVLIDLERQQRKAQNIHQLELQADLTKVLREHQTAQDKKDRLESNNHSSS